MRSTYSLVPAHVKCRRKRSIHKMETVTSITDVSGGAGVVSQATPTSFGRKWVWPARLRSAGGSLLKSEDILLTAPNKLVTVDTQSRCV